MSLHQDDVGHTIIAGPTGAGKSTLLNLIACQWLRYPGARVYIFDKGASCRAMTLAMGGDFYDLGGEGEEICFQPFAGIEDESELAWAQDWIADLLHREKAEITPATKQELWAALSNDAARAANAQHAPRSGSRCRCPAGDAELHARRTSRAIAGCEP
jgi:type IV secretion system protein VirB4